MSRFLLIIPLLLSASLCACNSKDKATPDSSIDVTDAVNAMRFQKPEGVIAPEDIAKSMKITLNSHYPIWRKELSVFVDVSIKNITKSHLPGRVNGHLYIYSIEEKKPMFVSHIDMAYAEPAAPTSIGVISIPVGGTKDLRIPVAGTKWGAINSQTWPDTPFYDAIPTGKYAMRFELDVFDENDQIIESVASNSFQFATILTAPDVIVPEGDQP